METGKATLTNYRQAPRKVRLLADMVRGKEVNEAIKTLRFTVKRGSLPMIKLIESAWANAKNEGASPKDMFKVSKIAVDQGLVMKRSMPRARGRAFPIMKRCSHVTVVLARFEDTKKEDKKVASKIAEAAAKPKKETKNQKTTAKKAVKK